MLAIDRFKAARLYVITCPPAPGETYEQMVRDACAGGADVVQFRAKNLVHRDLYEIGSRLRAICQEYGVLFIVNDFLEVALACGADGVHLGQEDGSISQAREIARQMGVRNFLIGRSTHSLEQAVIAQRDGADYIGVGPVYSTPTKPTYESVGLELVQQVSRYIRIPHVAIGGIEIANVDDVLAAGAQRVAVVRAVCGSPDIREAAARMKACLAGKVVVG